jgi:hypothetical protein
VVVNNSRLLAAEVAGERGKRDNPSAQNPDVQKMSVL